MISLSHTDHVNFKSVSILNDYLNFTQFRFHTPTMSILNLSILNDHLNFTQFHLGNLFYVKRKYKLQKLFY